MSPRGRLIAAQAAVVAIAAGVVYLTLLSTDGGGPLTGIEAPGGDRAGDGGRQEADRRDHRPRRDRGRALAAAGPQGARPAVSGVAAPVEGEPRARRVRIDLSPTDAQYDDTVAQLDALLRMSEP